MTDEQALMLVRAEFDRLFVKPASEVDRAELFALANNIPWLFRLADEALRLRAILAATEAQIAIGMADLGMPVAEFPPADLHPADKIEKHLVPFAYDRLTEDAVGAIDGEASDEYAVLAYIEAAKRVGQE